MKNTKLRIASVLGILAFSLSSFVYLNLEGVSPVTTGIEQVQPLLVSNNDSNAEDDNNIESSEWVLRTIIHITESLISGEIDNSSNLLN